MGVPAFFAWLSKRYPKIVKKAREERPRVINGHQIPIDVSSSNPNGIEFDNLYVDMNNIVHPCCHPEGQAQPPTEGHMMLDIFKYMDRLMSTVRPRRLVYLAIDGVAPRAKMNQQRSRRFRAAQESAEKAEKVAARLKEMVAAGMKIPTATDPFDSNSITPGTEFMGRLSEALQYYVLDRISNDPGWRELEVVLSDSSVPGEGEHKIMHFIRRQARAPGYDKGQHHLLYGADADLIMLGLSTHEKSFHILREEFIPPKKGHRMDNCEGVAEGVDPGPPIKTRPPMFLLIDLALLRKELSVELQDVGRGRKGKYSKVRRLIDDWIFLCCFVGNDFLPHLPSLSIHEGAIDTLVSIYHRMLPQLGGYLTDSGNLNVQRVKMLLGALGKLEDKVFRDRHEGVFNKKKKQRQEKLAARGVKDRDLSAKQLFEKTQRAHIDEIRVLPKVDDHASVDPETPLDPAADGPPVDIQGGQPPAQDGERPAEAGAVARKGQKASDEETEEESVEAVPVVQPGVKMSAFARQLAEKAEKARAKRLKKKKKKAQKRSRSPESQAPRVGMVGHSTGQRKRKESPEDAAMEDVTLPAEAGFMDVEVAGKPAPGGRHGERDGGMRDGGKAKKEDEVRLWEDGWKDRYYHVKLKASAGDGDFLRSISNAYIEGLAWVLRYYYHGCPSWEWFYPYHYAPFASDFKHVDLDAVKFPATTRPVTALEQLLGVFPPAAAFYLPPSWQPLMTSAQSPVADLYPASFVTDLNGKKWAWQGVTLLPFVDNERLTHAVAPVRDDLRPEDVRRNLIGVDVLAVHVTHPLAELLEGLPTTSPEASNTVLPGDSHLRGRLVPRKMMAPAPPPCGEQLDPPQNMSAALADPVQVHAVVSGFSC